MTHASRRAGDGAASARGAYPLPGHRAGPAGRFQGACRPQRAGIGAGEGCRARRIRFTAGLHLRLRLGAPHMLLPQADYALMITSRSPEARLWPRAGRPHLRAGPLLERSSKPQRDFMLLLGPG